MTGKLFDADDGLYIWISRWDEFQHYRPDPKRGPAWIKDYTAQLDDERYLSLTDRQRALLRDLRDIFATSRGRLRRDAPTIGRRRNAQTRDADLQALNHAGFIQVLSRAELERALDKFYRRSRAEEEKEKEPPSPPSGTNPAASPNGAYRCDHDGLEFKTKTRLDEHLRIVHDLEPTA